VLLSHFAGAVTTEEVFTPDDCNQIAKVGDHLLLNYKVTLSDGKLGPFLPDTAQPFHLVLGSEDEESALSNLKGMCENGTRRFVFDDGSDTNLNPIFVDKHFSENKGPLHVDLKLYRITNEEDYRIFDAFKSKNISMVLDLIDEHKGINSMDEYGQTPLMIAISNQVMPVVAALLNTRKPKVDVNAAKTSGFTALFYAVERATPSILQALLRRGADPNAAILTGSTGNTPLHFACMLEKVKHAKLLLEYGADAMARNANGQYPINMVPRDAVRSTKLMYKQIFDEVYKKKQEAALKGAGDEL
jgi:hypothetical protein